MNPLQILSAALTAAQQAARLYFSLRELWEKKLTAADKAALAAQEEDLFAQPHWRSPGAELRAKK